PSHFDQWSNVGLQAAIARIPATLAAGGAPHAGQQEIRRLFQGSVRGMPSVQVAYAARWTLNAFSGGSARAMKKGGGLTDEAEDNVYKTVMEGLESFAALLRVQQVDTGEGPGYAYTADGRKYRS